ncbi:AAA family ATPase [Hyphococcus sp.]|uniref:AAA family ATPase n=1 Tax=Hyphococcus sp. TaxID=2038636 RepID=UPI003CCBFBA1
MKNYKGFENANIPIKPLTLLLGKNSSGKTSLIQLILALYQSHSERTVHPTQLLHNGPQVNFGPAENLWHSKDLNRKLEFSFTFESLDLAEQITGGFKSYLQNALFRKLSFYTEYLLSQLEPSANEIEEFSNLQDALTQATEKFKNQKAYNSDATLPVNIFEPILEIEEVLSKIRSNLKNKNLGRYLSSRVRGFGVPDRELKSDLDLTFKLLRNFSAVEIVPNFTLHYEMDVDERNNIYAKTVTLHDANGKSIISISFERPNNISDKQVVKNIQSDFTDDNLGSFAGTLSLIVGHSYNSLLRINEARFYHEVEDLKGTRLAEFVTKVLSHSMEECFTPDMTSGVTHVPPLRAHPRRYYLSELMSQSFDEGIIFQSLEHSRTKAEINDWLSEFDVSIDVGELEQVIKRIMISPTNNPQLSLEIADVGFGFSQILPVISLIVSSRPDSLMVIEQPEVHLHPDMQAAFGDLLVRLSNLQDGNRQRHFIVETHSEYLLTEVRAQIAAGNISADQVSILFFESMNDGNNMVKSADIDENGAITWPTQFIERHFRNQKILIERQITK